MTGVCAMLTRGSHLEVAGYEITSPGRLVPRLCHGDHRPKRARGFSWNWPIRAAFAPGDFVTVRLSRTLRWTMSRCFRPAAITVGGEVLVI